MKSQDRIERIMDGAADGIACLAVDFIMQPETWPVFEAWVKRDGRVFLAELPDDIRPLRELLYLRLEVPR